MKAKNIKLLIFDLDGVLINSKNNMSISWKILSKENKLNIHFREYFKKIGLPFKQILSELGIKKNQNTLEKQYFKNSLKYKNKIKPYKNVNKILIKLQKKYLLSIVTSKRKKNSVIYTKQFFPKVKFSLICSPKKNIRSKPFPDQFNYTFKKLKVSAKNAIYVGDMVHDFTAAKRAKTNFILAKYGYLNKKIKTNYAIDNIKGLEKILKRF